MHSKYFQRMTPTDSTSDDWNSRLLPRAGHASSEEFKMRPLHAIAITVLVSTLAMADVRTHEPVSEQQSRGWRVREQELGQAMSIVAMTTLHASGSNQPR